MTSVLEYEIEMVIKYSQKNVTWWVVNFECTKYEYTYPIYNRAWHQETLLRNPDTWRCGFYKNCRLLVFLSRNSICSSSGPDGHNTLRVRFCSPDLRENIKNYINRHNKNQKSRNRYVLPNGVAVRVKSWSMNCPQATNITVPACSCSPSSGWTVRDTTLARGRGWLEADVLGADNLSENRGDINLNNEDKWVTKTGIRLDRF